MNLLQELLERWEHGDLSADDTVRLTEMLQSPEARAQLVRVSFDSAVIMESLRADQSTPAHLGEVHAHIATAPVRRMNIVHLALVATLLIGLCAFGWVIWKPTALHADLIASGDEVTIERAGVKMKVEYGVRFALRSGDLIQTNDGPGARVVYTDEATWIDLADNTDLQILQSNEGKRVVLHRGRFEADVAPQPAGMPMVCQTLHGRAIVLGTRFCLTVEHDRATLEVQKGTVRMRPADGGRTADVHARHFAESRSDGSFLEGEMGANGKYEGESLVYRDAEGPVCVRREEGRASGDYQRDFQPHGVGGSVTFLVPVARAGSYRVVIGASKFRNRGIYQLAIADDRSGSFVDQGTKRDYFAPGDYTYEDFDLGIVTFATPGDKRFRFTCVGHRPVSNSVRKLGIDYIQLQSIGAQPPAPTK